MCLGGFSCGGRHYLKRFVNLHLGSMTANPPLRKTSSFPRIARRPDLFPMDHLHCPLNPLSFDWEGIPYICSEDYDGGPFLTYPVRVGKPQAAPSEGYIGIDIYEYMRPSSLKNLEAFLQTWLFFGLLKEILGDLYCRGDFICTLASGGASRTILSTSKLLELLDAWDSRVKNSPTDKSAAFKHAAECLRVARDAFQASFRRTGFDPRIKGSIAATAEILGFAVERVLWEERTEWHKWHGHWGEFFEQAWLEDAGWCPMEVTRSTRMFNHFQTLFFFCKMRGTNERNKHTSLVWLSAV